MRERKGKPAGQHRVPEYKILAAAKANPITITTGKSPLVIESFLYGVQMPTITDMAVTAAIKGIHPLKPDVAAKAIDKMHKFVIGTEDIEHRKKLAGIFNEQVAVITAGVVAEKRPLIQRFVQIKGYNATTT